MWLCTEAAWKPKTARAGDFIVPIERGEYAAAVRYLATKWQWSKGKVERFLDLLKKQGMIETRTETGVTVISVCNYNQFQGGDDDTGTEADQEPGRGQDAGGTGPGQVRDAGGDNRKEINSSTHEEGKEQSRQSAAAGRPTGREVATDDGETSRAKVKPKREPARTRIDLDWQITDEMRQYALDRRWPPGAVDQQFEKFKNFHHGKGNLMASWPSAWRTWVGNGYDMKGGRGGSATPTRADSAIDGMFSDLRPEDFHGRTR